MIDSCKRFFGVDRSCFEVAMRVRVGGPESETQASGVKGCKTTTAWEMRGRFDLIGISLFTYILAVQLPLLKGQHGRTGRNTL
jgi:hypothetical protein